MTNVFSRTELLLGSEGVSTLAKSTVLIFGVGGVGSHCIEALARAGVGNLILVDNDVVSPSNINRQSIAYHSTIGEKKINLMEERIKDISPDTRVITFEDFVLPSNVDKFFEMKVDYIIDAIDTITAKICIVEKAKEHNIPILSCMGTGNKVHAELFEIGDLSKTSMDPLSRVMRRELKKRGIYHLKVLFSKEKPMDVGESSVPGSVSFVPPVAGLLIAGEVVRDILQM
ncbi:tRNA A37 threonylcarbamoyladenosine dehydratase [Aequitasia blattaphilus]|uniref:tRNA threonylcarbamoyladenosine dehydratase n=1 Tax=Aequitasia blattaphilus TaxID=2949332 RepID=A0ABT1E625_9FIRM|nr:tRNA threonylcarbamoyladenosine dehydratase [Aequitasia blattaphilus]MCP1101293.1 tRNA threonylcarbamoyladenosine dehydratase [Aequitasia blattaphilus]MCR8613933.1 tRNA threonylcarbamoyladenosine dehydratase [Aequitasia blattaphilus]